MVLGGNMLKITQLRARRPLSAYVKKSLRIFRKIISLIHGKRVLATYFHIPEEGKLEERENVLRKPFKYITLLKLPDNPLVKIWPEEKRKRTQ